MAAVEPVTSPRAVAGGGGYIAGGVVTGWLSKKGGLRWQKRFFVLDGMTLKYYLNNEDREGTEG